MNIRNYAVLEFALNQRDFQVLVPHGATYADMVVVAKRFLEAAQQMEAEAIEKEKKEADE